jgi:anthranilate synthase component 1/para-aminobenzoate synthetase
MVAPDFSGDVADGVAGRVRRLLAERVGGRGPAPVVVGVDGRSGAGKTVLAAAVRARLKPGTDVTVVSLEPMYRGWHGLAAGTRLWSEQVLQDLAAGRPAEYAGWDWHAGREGPTVLERPARVVLAEGVGVGVRAARPRLDLLVWLEVPPEVRRRRALARDGAGFGRWWDAWAQQEAELLAADPVPASAGLVVSGTGASPDVCEA